jgi:hypothetical protein
VRFTDGIDRPAEDDFALVDHRDVIGDLLNPPSKCDAKSTVRPSSAIVRITAPRIPANDRSRPDDAHPNQ